MSDSSSSSSSDSSPGIELIPPPTTQNDVSNDVGDALSNSQQQPASLAQLMQGLEDSPTTPSSSYASPQILLDIPLPSLTIPSATTNDTASVGESNGDVLLAPSSTGTPNVFESGLSTDDDDDDEDFDPDLADVSQVMVNATTPQLGNSVPSLFRSESNEFEDVVIGEEEEVNVTGERRVKKKEKAKRLQVEDVEMSDCRSPDRMVETQQSVVGLSISSKRIRELCKVEEQISKLMMFASETVQSLILPSVTVNTDDSKESLTKFSTSTQSYFTTLNETHLALRTSISHLTTARISPRILFQTSTPTFVPPQPPPAPTTTTTTARPLTPPLPPPPLNPNPSTFVSSVGVGCSIGQNDQSLEALSLELEAWKHVLESLSSI